MSASLNSYGKKNGRSREWLLLFFFFFFYCPILMPQLSTLHAQEKGKASYYSKNMNGRRMSSGLRYHRDSMFCAHKKHPFGTLLKVTNPKNGKSVVVKVTDRGPFGHGRIIDLSYGAAKKLGILSAGVAMVVVSVYRENKGIPFKPYDYIDELPELDYEVTEDDGDYIPEWRTEKKGAGEQKAEKKKPQTEEAAADKENHNKRADSHGKR